MNSTRRRVAMATVIGTTIEWYDFFIYGTAAGLVFSQLFFAPAGAEIGLLLSFATVGISFVFRPLGAFLAGHFGDRIGRRAMLVLTLVLMGGATSLIGLLPTYETAVVQSTGNVLSVGAYLLGMFVVAVVATLLLRDRPGVDLGVDNQAEQEAGATVLGARRELGTVHGVAS
jgi:MFS family permease